MCVFEYNGFSRELSKESNLLTHKLIHTLLNNLCVYVCVLLVRKTNRIEQNELWVSFEQPLKRTSFVRNWFIIENKPEREREREREREGEKEKDRVREGERDRENRMKKVRERKRKIDKLYNWSQFEKVPLFGFSLFTQCKHLRFACKSVFLLLIPFIQVFFVSNT